MSQNKTYIVKSALLITVLIVTSLISFSFYADDELQANDDFSLVNLNSTEIINVLNNDYGLNSGVSSVVVTDKPLHGSVLINPDYTISYTPFLNYEGDDEFKYKVCNKEGICGSAVVSVDVVYYDYKPLTVNDTVSFYWTSEKLIDVTQNDTNLLNFPISLEILDEPHLGTGYISGDTAIVYMPKRGFKGRDSIQYMVCDVENDCSEAWVQIEILSAESEEVFIPNGFSPNGDGFNDVFFVPEFKKVSRVQLKVFTGWGAIVYKNDDYQNDWDGMGNHGTYSGKQLDIGTYYYEFIVPDLSKTFTGYIYLNK